MQQHFQIKKNCRDQGVSIVGKCACCQACQLESYPRTQVAQGENALLQGLSVLHKYAVALVCTKLNK